MSAWWVLSSVGLCACVPGTDVLLLSAPLFSATLHLPGGDLRVVRIGEGDQVRSVTLDGSPLARAWLRFDEIARGGELAYTMGDRAGDWGALPADAPPSFPPDR
jgi:putative alpha-1,2-mannosidase